METPYADIRLLRAMTLLLVVVAIAGLVGLTALFAPSGPWLIPAGVLAGMLAILHQMAAQEKRTRTVGCDALTTR